MPRKYLVWCSAKRGKCAAKLYGEDRLFDVAIHDYADWESYADFPRKAEYWIPSTGTEKLETAGAHIASLPPYDIYAFLDDDLEINTEKLNLLFLAGEANKLELYQPALTLDSCCSWRHLKQNTNWLTAGPRPVPFVEIMCPFFSRAALDKCAWSFTLNQSGWGLDCYIWPQLVKCNVIDAVTIRHPGPFRQYAQRVMRNGLSAFDELDIVKKIQYDGPSQW